MKKLRLGFTPTGERGSLSLSRSAVAQKHQEVARKEQATLSLRMENDTLRVRLKTAEEELGAIGRLMGEKSHRPDKYPALVKRLTSYKEMQHRIHLLQHESDSFQRAAAEERNKLQQKCVSAETELIGVKEHIDKLSARNKNLEIELKASQAECTGLNRLLRDCQCVLESLGSVSRDGNKGLEWSYRILNARRAAKKAVFTHDSLSLPVQRRVSSSRLSSVQKPQDSLVPFPWLHEHGQTSATSGVNPANTKHPDEIGCLLGSGTVIVDISKCLRCFVLVLFRLTNARFPLPNNPHHESTSTCNRRSDCCL